MGNRDSGGPGTVGEQGQWGNRDSGGIGTVVEYSIGTVRGGTGAVGE